MNTNSEAGGRALVLLAVLFLGGAGCDWLISQDHTPPVCAVTSPFDSALVSGTELITASATDSVGVLKVEFLVDDALIATDTIEPYSAEWPTAGLAVNSWHRIQCKATDYNNNVGASGVVNVQVVAGGQRDVFHGRMEIDAGYYVPVGFTAEAGDTLAGDVLVTAGGTLGAFLCLDRQNYASFAGGRQYTALLRQNNAVSFTVSQAVPAGDSLYLVFWNSGAGQRQVWARFVLE
jgi:hypothetical protein